MEYAYNANGAMTKDLNKGISSISYNLLNLPQQVDILSPLAEARNAYSYSADGVKLRVVKKYNSNFSTSPVIGSAVNTSKLNVTQTTDYVDGKIFENNVLDRIFVDGGYIKGGVYYFYETDHLGDNRTVINQSGTVVERNDYYPFGMQMAHNQLLNQASGSDNKRKFGNKELDVMGGLNLYDFSARNHDPTLGRFTTVDPLAEKYYSISPYAYCVDNPIALVDPDGLAWFYYSVDGKSDPTWNWRDDDNNQYHTGVKDSNGNEVVIQGYDAVVTADGSTDEHAGKDGNIFGEDAKLANFTVYGPSGKDDIQHYRGLTMTSNFKKYGAIDNGEYEVNYRNPGKNGKIKSNWAVNNTNPVDCLFGENRNPDGYSNTQKNGVYIHSTLGDNGRVGSRTSTGCILIVPSGHGENGWNEFNNQLQGVSSFHFVLNRTGTSSHYPEWSNKNLQFNLQYILLRAINYLNKR